MEFEGVDQRALPQIKFLLFSFIAIPVLAMVLVSVHDSTMYLFYP